MIIKLLRDPTEEEMEQIVNICVSSYSENLSVKASLGGDWSLHAEFQRARARAVALEGELYVGVIESSGKIVSTAHWYPPGRSLFGTEAQRALGYNELMSKLKEETKKWEKNVFNKRVAEVHKLFEKQELPRRWWCVNLATDPEYRQNGFASALMQVLADKADQHNLILGLGAVTDETVRFYQSIGYRERGSVDVPAPTGDFTVHILSRERSGKPYH